MMVAKQEKKRERKRGEKGRAKREKGRCKTQKMEGEGAPVDA
jgi:hypothetical protein